MSNVASINQKSRFVVSQLTDAALEPAFYYTRGTLETVVSDALKAIAMESHQDLTMVCTNLTMGPTNGSLSFDGGQKTRLGYTRQALIQLADRLHQGEVIGTAKRELTPTAWGNAALWCAPSLRAQFFAQMRDGATSERRTRTSLVFRTARDVHHGAIGTEYIRAIVSQQHSGSRGDDLEYLAALRDFAVTARENGFVGAQTFYRRDPVGDSVLVADSKATLPGGARLTMRFTNNECGKGSAHVGLGLTFEIEAEREYTDADGQKSTMRRITVEIPGERAAEVATHKGARPQLMFSAFAEKTALVLAWAPSAIEKMSAVRLSSLERISDEYVKVLAPLYARLEGTERAQRQAEVLKVQDQLRMRGIPAFSALETAVVLAAFGLQTQAGELVKKHGGVL